jgi:Rod binding domain-containing protein
MAIAALAALPVGLPAKTANVQKVVEAAQEFEAVMLESFLRPLEESFSSLPGGDDSMGMSGYRDMVTQAMASAIAKAGGFGLADMVVRNLLHLKMTRGGTTAIGTGGAKAIKGFSPYADSN